MESYGKYDRPVKIADGVFWVGFRDKNSSIFCNPYLIVEDGQAVLIDSGSRGDFAIVMMRILQAGIDPSQIIALIYQHYDPDLCGSMPNFIDMCDNPDLKLFSEESNKLFLSHYIHKDTYHLLHSINDTGFQFQFNNRILRFISTPYAHSQGSFVTYDEKTGTLFSSDLFGSFSTEWDLFLQLQPECFACTDYHHCSNQRDYCPFPGILDFHRSVMPCGKALGHAIKKIKEVNMDMVAPQHGSILKRRQDIQFVADTLASLRGVGIDAIVPD